MRRLLCIAVTTAVVSSMGATWMAPSALAAEGDTYYAYAHGEADAPTSCPSADAIEDQCTLEQALALNANDGGGGTVLLATPGATDHYYGNWSIAADVTIQPAAGVTNPTLDGDDGGAGEQCATATCNGSILVNYSYALTVDRVTFANAHNTQTAPGGAIQIVNALGVNIPTLTVTNSTFVDNVADFGGGGAIAIGFGSTATVTNSTFARNSSLGGGALLNASGTVVVANSTFWDNGADIGIGRDIFQATLTGFDTASLTIIASTFGSSDADDPSISTNTAGLDGETLPGSQVAIGGSLLAAPCDQTDGDWTDLGYNAATTSETTDGESCLSGGSGNGNVVNDDVADLGNLANNGGPTQTILPVATNPANNAIPNNPTSVETADGTVELCPRTDQRGVASTGDCTAGSVELNAAAPGDGGGGGGGGAPPVTVTVTSSDDQSESGDPVTFTATVSPTPNCGSVTWLIDNVPPPAGTPTSGSGATYTLGPISTLGPGLHPVTAVFSGCASFGAGSGTVNQEVTDEPTGDEGPTITAKKTSAHPRHHGWYRSPVTITFTCTAGDAPLTGPCPDPVKLRKDGKGQTVTRSIEDTEGRSASVTRKVNIDRTDPTIEVDGAKDGKSYTKKQDMTCKTTDALSGPASCVVHQHRKEHKNSTVTYRYLAVGKDLAGNKTKVRGSYTVS